MLESSEDVVGPHLIYQEGGSAPKPSAPEGSAPRHELCALCLCTGRGSGDSLYLPPPAPWNRALGKVLRRPAPGPHPLRQVERAVHPGNPHLFISGRGGPGGWGQLGGEPPPPGNLEIPLSLLLASHPQHGLLGKQPQDKGLVTTCFLLGMMATQMCSLWTKFTHAVCTLFFGMSLTLHTTFRNFKAQ